MFNLSPIYSAHKSSNHKLFKNHKISSVHKFTFGMNRESSVEVISMQKLKDLTENVVKAKWEVV